MFCSSINLGSGIRNPASYICQRDKGKDNGERGVMDMPPLCIHIFTSSCVAGCLSGTKPLCCDGSPPAIAIVQMYCDCHDDFACCSSLPSHASPACWKSSAVSQPTGRCRGLPRLGEESTAAARSGSKVTVVCMIAGATAEGSCCAFFLLANACRQKGIQGGRRQFRFWLRARNQPEAETAQSLEPRW